MLLPRQYTFIHSTARVASWVSGATWAPAFIALATFTAFWWSFAAIAPLLGVDSPSGLVPVVPLLAVWLAFASVHRRVRARQPLVGDREGVVDYPVALALLISAAWLVWRAPMSDGWYFWSQRLDLLAAALFGVGVAVLLWGVQTVMWHKAAVLYAFLMWPAVLVRIQEVITEPLAMWSALLARPIALWAQVPLEPVGYDARVFSSAASAAGSAPWTFFVGDVCAGLNAALTVALVSVPAAVQLGLTLRRATLWALGGVALALVANVLRVAALLVVADRVAPAFALGIVHPILGAILMAVVFLILWAVAPAQRAASGSPVGEASDRHFSFRSLARFAGPPIVLVALFAAGSARLAAFEPLPPVGPPGGVVNSHLEYLSLPPGWQIHAHNELMVQNLFGSDSRSYSLSLISERGDFVLAQVITTPHRAKLQAYGLDACRIFHGDDVVGRRTVRLGAGGVATLIDTMTGKGLRRQVTLPERLSALYWEAPFSLQGREMHARVTLFVRERDEHNLKVTTTQGIAPGGAEFDRADTALVELAQGIAQQVVTASRSSTFTAAAGQSPRT